ncbi:DMT family transporter [Mycoplana dimorpha]|uniref:EamA-like transporter family protein n=1 Tax=Mycoplana dimorpha TaxID=28320 RepID=A0A2T5AZA4_MYCDI|nr:DMT family transporter [Mycoplana dimorpha]PTM92068.1 EamA-like transporter family protein [Mycoplana dimorpha]
MRFLSTTAAGMLLGLVGVTIFGATLPMTRVALEAFSPLFLTMCRAVIAAAAAGAALILLRRPFPREHLPALAGIGLGAVFGFPIFSSIALQTIPASHGGVVLGILPLLTSIFAALVDGERPGPLFWLCGIAGSALVVAFSLREGGFHLGGGDVWLFLAAISASFSYVLSGKLARALPGWEVIGWALVLCAPFTLVGTLLVAGSGIHSPGPAQYGALLYLGLMSMFGGFIFWNAGLALGGIARVAQVQLFQTFVTLAIAALLLGEAIGASTVGFALAVAFVVWLGRKAKISRIEAPGAGRA